ncbi:MAG TPA: class I SAM-dependent methyltransferase [Dehalococcoidia bacterium]
MGSVAATPSSQEAVPVLDRVYTVDLAVMGVQRGQRVLDLGCGKGRHLTQALAYPIHVVGADIDFQELYVGKYMVVFAHGRRYHPDAVMSMVVADGAELPFPDASFDHVVCAETLEHVPDPGAVVDEIVRVLKPGGTAGFSVPDLYAETVMKGLCDLLGFQERYVRMTSGHVRVFRRGELSRMLRARGLVPYHVTRREVLDSFYWLARLLISDRAPGSYVHRAVARFLDSRRVRFSRFIHALEAPLAPFWAKSVVVYARKPPAPVPAAPAEGRADYSSRP